MRIAFVSHCRRKVGGAEVYLDSVLPAFARAGHEVAWLAETDPPSLRDPISCPSGTPQWTASEVGPAQALQGLWNWKPDIVYTHGLYDPAFEGAILDIGPSVLYVHNYYGTCISGDKLHSTSTPKVCERRFGAACLLHYFPEHCGGRNPLTMWSKYRLQAKRLELMRHYSALIANSQYMVRELGRHDLQAECVYPFSSAAVSCAANISLYEDPIRLVFAGRMSSLKGGSFLIAAAPDVQKALQRNVHITLAGDGPDRNEWQRLAASRQSDQLTFSFPGWLATADLQGALAKSHLLVFPSIWPEPFGLSGLEAGLLGVPTVAYSLGGVPEWLKEDVNGHLAPAPPKPNELAETISKALSDPAHYTQLRAGACREAHRYRLDDHMAQLNQIFERCAQ